jgi:hypothetical protein
VLRGALAWVGRSLMNHVTNRTITRISKTGFVAESEPSSFFEDERVTDWVEHATGVVT